MNKGVSQRTQKAKDLFSSIDPKNHPNEDKGIRATIRAKPINTSSYRNEYLRSIYDPENVSGIGIPDDFTMKSQKMQVQMKFQGATGTQGFGGVWLNPHFLGANNSSTTYCTDAAGTFTGNTIVNTGTGIATQESNSVYTVSDLRRSGTYTLSTSNATAGKRFRLVSCRLRVTSLASSTAVPGEMIGLITPTHESMQAMTFNDLSTYPENKSIIAERGNSIELYYTPVWKSEYEYHACVDSNAASVTKDACRFIFDASAVPASFGAAYAQYSPMTSGVSNECNAYQPFMGVIVSGAATGTPCAFQVVIHANFEFIGAQIGQLATPSPYSSRMLDEAKMVSAVAPSVSATRDGETPFGQKASSFPGKLLDMAMNVASGQFLPAALDAASLIADLF